VAIKNTLIMATTSVLLEWMLYNNDVMSDVRRLIHKTPNDQDLGNKIREYVSGRDNDRKLATKSHNQFDNTED